ncbi:hypothetical protein J3R83DRAFT_5617 [Lanmaoa asiatica]|nr:hypothetical protein J3R83DRAFT_5617 [Lanmaoa asiatica]
MTREAYEQVSGAICESCTNWSLTSLVSKVINEPHKAKLSHELIAAAASYEAMKAYNDHCEKQGKPVSHSTAKEIMAAASGAFIDRIIETKGLDAIDKARSKEHGE